MNVDNFSTDDFNESDCIDSSLTQARQKLMSSGNMRTSASDCLKTFKSNRGFGLIISSGIIADRLYSSLI